MNLFAAEHPLTAQPSWLDSKPHPQRSYVCQSLTAALILLALFAVILGCATLYADNEDVPDPTWVDSLFAPVGFLMMYPAALAAPVVDLEKPVVAVGGFVLDGIFWAFVMVALYRMLRWWFQRRRSRGDPRAPRTERQPAVGLNL
jgi:hypothetical protein